MRLVVIDFETFFSDDYTLKKMSTEAYIRDPRFQAHGAAVKWSPNTQAKWYDEKELRYHLAQEDWRDIGLICWHAQFDGFILSHHYNIRPRQWFCPMSMARLLIGNHVSVALDSMRAHFGLRPKITPYNLFRGKYWSEMDQATRVQVGEGACDEVESIWQIFGRLSRNFPAEEYDVVDQTIRMFTEPELCGDIDALARVWESENSSKVSRLAALGVSEADLQSAERFAQLLRVEGVEPEKKNGKNGDIYAFAKTDSFMERLLEDEDERVRTLAEARLGVKSTMLQTRAEAIGWASRRGPLPVYLKYAGAHTTRWAGGDQVNYQNMNSALEAAILPPEKFFAFAPDSSQIECIAEGQVVLTNHGPKAIQDVKLADEVWDGQEFVVHGGVVYKGIQEVISYQGLTATPEHVIYPTSGRFAQGVSLRTASALGLDIQAPNRANAVCKATLRSPVLRGIQNVWRTRHSVSFFKRQGVGTLGFGESAARDIRRRGNRPQEQRRPLRARKSKIIDAARKCQQSLHDVLGFHVGRIALGNGRFQTSLSAMWLSSRSNQRFGGERSNRRANNRTLAKSTLEDDLAQAPNLVEKARVYDIINAGPRFRFMVSGVIVSNCRLLNMVAGQEDKIEEFRQGKDPYVGNAEAFCGHPVTKDSHPTLRQGGKVVELQGGYMSGGAKIEATLRRFKVPYQEGDGEKWKHAYRDKHPRVVELWKAGGRMISRLAGGSPLPWGPVTVQEGRIVLPNGCPMIYADLNYHKDDETGESYWRHKTRHGWRKLYSGLLVENLIQALARVVISQAMVRLNRLGYRPLNMKHDAIWYALPIDRADEHARVIRAEMCRVPEWLPGLPLGAEGKPGTRFGK